MDELVSIDMCLAWSFCFSSVTYLIVNNFKLLLEIHSLVIKLSGGRVSALKYLVQLVNCNMFDIKRGKICSNGITASFDMTRKIVHSRQCVRLGRHRVKSNCDVMYRSWSASLKPNTILSSVFIYRTALGRRAILTWFWLVSVGFETCELPVLEWLLIGTDDRWRP